MARRGARQHVWLGGALGLVLAIGQVPQVLAWCCAPAGATGLGTAWFVNDFAQYESAMRQGAEHSGWLIHDAFTAEPHQAAFMFPLYVGLGKLGATLHIPAALLEHVLEVLARVALVLGTWRFAHAFTRRRAAARWAFGLALFGSGLELLVAPLGGAIYSGNWSYEVNGFGLLFAAPHVPLAMAATLELAREVLRRRGSLTPGWLGRISLLSASIALLHPFHLPVLLGAAVLAGVAFKRVGHGSVNLIGSFVASLAALPVLWPTVATFSFDPFWQATYTLQNRLASPAPLELLVDLGPTLLLAGVGGCLLRQRIAPPGLLAWLALMVCAMYLPMPYQRRLSFGLQPGLAVLAGNGLIAVCASLEARRAMALRLGVVATAASGTLLILASIVASGFTDAPLPIYRSTGDLDAAAAWLDGQALPDDVILADWQAANYLAPLTAARVFGGHPVATLEAASKEVAATDVFRSDSSLVAARALGAQWLVYGPGEADLTSPSRPVFQSGVVRVYRVLPG